MRKLLALMLLLCCLFTTVPVQGEDSPFSYMAFQDFIDENPLYGEFTLSLYEEHWDYCYSSWRMRSHTVKKDDFSVKLSWSYGILGSDSDEGFPYIHVSGTSEKKLEVARIDCLVMDRVYTIDMSNVHKYRSVEKNEDGTHTFTATAHMGVAGVDWLKDMATAGGMCTIRIYYDKKNYLEVERSASHIATTFFKALPYVGYLSKEGTVPPTILRSLQFVDKDRSFPNTSVSPVNDRIWPVITPAPTPLAQLGKADVTQYKPLSVGDAGDNILELRMRMYALGYFQKEPTQTSYTSGMVEYVNEFQRQNGLPIENVITPEYQALLFSEHAMPKATPTPRPTASPKPTATPFIEPIYALQATKYGEWSRSNGVPWFKSEMKNNSKEITVNSVTYIYYCLDKDGSEILSATGEKFSTATVDSVLRPGRKVMLPRVQVTNYENVKKVCVALYGYTTSDGEEVILSERDWVFWHFEYR